MKEKELAKQEWFEMIKKSWTWAKLTENEKEKFSKLLDHPCTSYVIRGDYKNRWEACDALYHTFLVGLDYDEEPMNWRDFQTESTVYYELDYKAHNEQQKPLTMTDRKQARRLACAVKSLGENTDVHLLKVETRTTEMEIR